MIIKNVAILITLSISLILLNYSNLSTAIINYVEALSISENMTNASVVNNTNASGVNNTNSGSKIAIMSISSASTTTSTDAKSLNVKIEPSPFPVTAGDVKLKISFLQPTNIVQVHVDYDVSIMKDNQEIFRASSVTGQPLLHTAEGVVTIPYKFDQPGKYLITVSVMGINFIPIRTEVANFNLDVK